MRFSTATVFSALMAFAAAYTKPDYNKPPQGNPIYTPSLQEQVPKGVPFAITWDPTLGSKVSLVLLRGPSSNVVPLETIVENIDNTGSYTWTPPANLDVDTTHYGLLLVVEGTGAYQWSTQFGISAGADTSSSSSSSVAAATTTTAAAVTETTAASSTKATIVTVIDDVTTTYCPEEASSTAAVSAATTESAAASSYSTIWATFESTTTICPETETTAAATTAAATTVTGVPVPPYSTRVPIRSTMRSSAAPSGAAPTGTAAAPSSTPVFNGAGRNAISFGAVVAAAFAVFAL
ncbi:GPI anchored serine-threonine rich protein [Penicillium sp. IBT 18751x]|nr:GPI anchored serine-threonine rich protein [Penicillium sp. IBT 18751x]